MAKAVLQKRIHSGMKMVITASWINTTNGQSIQNMLFCSGCIENDIPAKRQHICRYLRVDDDVGEATWSAEFD